MLFVDAGAGVLDGKAGRSIGQQLPAHINLPARRRIAHGIGQQIGKRTVQLCARACQISGLPQRLLIRKVQHMGFGLLARQGIGQATSLVLTAIEQLRHRHPVIVAGQRASLQARQGQQVFHQMLHALGLLGHQLQIAPALVFLERQVLQGLDKTGQHGQRRADFVRDIGHEVAAHGLGLLQRRHIARQQQLAPFTVAVELHRQLDRPRRCAFAPLHDQIMTEVLRRKIGTELRISHQITDALQHIALGVKAELLGGNLIAPFDAALCIEQDHTIGTGLQGRQNVIEPLVALLHLLHALANPAAHAHAGLAPDPCQIGHRAQLRLAQPVQQPRAIPAVHQPPYPAADQGARHGRHALLQHRRTGCNEIGPQQPYHHGCRDLRSQQSKTTPPHICFQL